MSNETIFGWLYGYRLTRQPDMPIFITCAGRADGAGAQAQAIISTQAAARALGIHYAHTPFRCMEHAPKDPADWATRWEKFLNLGDGEVQAASLGLQPIPLSTLIWEPERWNDEPLLVYVHHAHDFTDHWVDSYRLIVPLLRRRYSGFSGHPRKLSGRPNDVEVAVHVRRGDVTLEQNPARYTHNCYILRVIRTIARLVADYGLRPKLVLYSEGRSDSFRGFADCGCTFHLSEDAQAAFHGLVSADVLVMAKSSFSYTAALLSNGVKMYGPFWHPPLAEWVSLDHERTFDEVRFISLLLNHLRRRETGAGSEAPVLGVAALPHPNAPQTASASADDVRLWATEAEAVQNVEIGAYGDGLASSVAEFGRRCGLSWSIRLSPGIYDVFAEYAAAERRPTHLLIDGFPVAAEAMADPTGGWFEADLRWSALARVRIVGETCALSLRRDGAIPHIRQLRVLSVSRG
jgi:hypothetical protein